ncbi:ANTAR domain protein [Roseivivax sp. THAF40]|uniref:ANTAR domain-containing protein n=1 Tax=Roseivivax sp. THAF40 TaxID=2587858 RepID=UPI0012685BC5|nr:ANTAR domain-containing protein [Roseivivax sp. THAF40]QFT45404.1 ANTAR domain protein [Roseivivax sp. THAF40]
MTYSFAGMQACVLHPSTEVRERVALRLSSLGIRTEGRWPALLPEDAAVDLLVVDIDRGEDGQFPWPSGEAPMPVVGLVGSETPGRLQWALRQDVDAFLPIGATATLFSALVIATARHAERAERRRATAEADRRNGLRLEVIRAVLVIMRREDIDEAAALKRLRAFAMVEQLPLEDAATQLLSDLGDAKAWA